MGAKTGIGWTDLTWNYAIGCDKVDADCKYCYMYRQSLNGTRYTPNQVVRTKTVQNLPLKYKGTQSECWGGRPLVFTSSLTDMFHPALDSYRHEMWEIIRKCPHLIFQILTKRPERIVEHLPDDWGTGYNNVWLGTSIGSNKGMERAYHLISIPAKIRFLSLEPLHQPVDISQLLNLTVEARTGLRGSAIDWVIVGGESGNDNGKYLYRPCHLEWIEFIVSDCFKHNIPVFVKQLGTYLSKQFKMTDRAGANLIEFPLNIAVRQFPPVYE